MAVKKISVPFSKKGMEEAAKWLMNYKRFMQRRVDKLLAKMLNEGEKCAIRELVHIDTGETLSTIGAYRNGNQGFLLVGGNAVWIEFGTGVIANDYQAYPHPKAQELGMNAIGTYVAPYPLNKTGVPHGSDPNGWWYEGDDGEYYHTYGIPANMFFYNTAQYLRKEYPHWAKEIFKK